MVLNYIWVAFFRHRIPHRGREVGFRRRCGVFPAIMDSHVQFRQDGFRDFPRPDRRALALDGHHENRGKRRSGPHSGTRPQPAFLQALPGHSQEPSRHRKHFHEHLCQHVGTGQCGHAVGTESHGRPSGTEPEKDTASNPMIMFLVLNTSG